MGSHVQVSEVNAILPLCPFPPLHWWFLAQEHHGGSSILSTNEPFVKQTFRNRLQLVQAGGALNVSFPIKKSESASNARMKDALLSSHVSPKSSWRSIQTAYGAAPFYEHFAPELEALWHEHLPRVNDDVRRLSDWSLTALQWMATTCQWQMPNLSDALIDFQDQLDLRERNALRGNAWTFNRYTQLYEDRQPFLGGLSALDALFILGPHELKGRLGELVQQPQQVD